MPLLEEDERYAVARSAKRFVHFSWTARIDISSIDIAPPSLKAPAFELNSSIESIRLGKCVESRTGRTPNWRLGGRS